MTRRITVSRRYTPDGEYLGGFGGSHGDAPGELSLPWGVHVDEFGDIYVVDWGNNRLQVFDADGELKNVIGKLGSGDGEFNRPTGVAVGRARRHIRLGLGQ